MRSFVAIELPEGIRQALAEVGRRLGRANVRASWVRPDRMHLTLRFLGDISRDDADRIGEMLARGYADAVPFDLEVAGVGAFPNVRRPSVLWTGVEPVEGGLSRAHDVAEQAARAIGLDPETRAFRPHLTIARVKESSPDSGLGDRLADERDFRAGGFTVRGVSLFSSTLTPRGPIYRCLREFVF